MPRIRRVAPQSSSRKRLVRDPVVWQRADVDDAPQVTLTHLVESGAAVGSRSLNVQLADTPAADVILRMAELWESKLPQVLDAIGSMIRDEYRRIPVLQRDLPRLRCLVDLLSALPVEGSAPEILRSYLATPDIWREASPRPKWSRATNGGYYSTGRAIIAPDAARKGLVLRIQLKPGHTLEQHFE
jgi:hypothetical protein